MFNAYKLNYDHNILMPQRRYYLDNLSHEVYEDEVFAQNYASRIEYNAHNALYERPATLSLLPEVNGKTVLDAGCGPGAYTEWLTERGASVTAVDYSKEMISIARRKVGDKAKFVKANLNNPLTFIEDGTMDIILSSMTLHYIRDWRMIFNEFNRVLKPEGEFVFSIHHPFMDFTFHPQGNYHLTELIEDEWPAFNVRMKYYRRPLAHVFNVLKETEFRLTDLLEPIPVEECRKNFPDTYEELSRKPWFIFFKAVKEK